MDQIATLERKDPNNENGLLTNVVELEQEAVFGRMARTVHCCSKSGSTQRKFSSWKDVLLVIFQGTGLIS